MEVLKIERAKFLGDVVGTLTFSIAVPTLKRFTANKLYPYFSEKWDMWRYRKNREVCVVKILENSDIEQEEKIANDRINNLREYRKRA